MGTRTKHFAVLVAVMLLSPFALSQLIVDARAVVRQRARSPEAGRVGSIGRKLPIRITIVADMSRRNPDGTTEVQFVLKNSGDKELVLPISPNPGDFEPRDVHLSYAVEHLSLYVTSDEREGTVLGGGAQLYGNQSLPASLVVLAPRESIRVLTNVNLPSGDQSSSKVFIAHAILNHELVTTVRGHTTADVEEVGSAKSERFALSTQR